MLTEEQIAEIAERTRLPSWQVRQITKYTQLKPVQKQNSK